MLQMLAVLSLAFENSSSLRVSFKIKLVYKNLQGKVLVVLLLDSHNLKAEAFLEGVCRSCSNKIRNAADTCRVILPLLLQWLEEIYLQECSSKNFQIMMITPQ